MLLYVLLMECQKGRTASVLHISKLRIDFAMLCVYAQKTQEG